jgi:hypothetical protein
MFYEVTIVRVMSSVDLRAVSVFLFCLDEIEKLKATKSLTARMKMFCIMRLVTFFVTLLLDVQYMRFFMHERIVHF